MTPEKQPLVPTIVPVEEYPLQAQLIMITTEINYNDDSFEKNNKVEDDIKNIYIFGGIFME